MRISDWSSDVCSSDLLCLTLALTQPSVGTAASASLEFMGLHPGMTLDQVEQALEQQGLDLPKLSRAPSFEQEAALARGEHISPNVYNGVQTLRAENGDNKVQIHFVSLPVGPVAAKITVEVFSGADGRSAEHTSEIQSLMRI